METRRIRRVDTTASGLSSQPDTLTYQYLKIRRGREGLQKNEDLLKKELLVVLTETGDEDDKGNRFYYLDEPDQDVTGVKRERRVAQIMDSVAAMALIEKYKLQDSCIEMVPQINEDGLLAANFGGQIPDEEFASLYTEKETFALVLIKEK